MLELYLYTDSFGFLGSLKAAVKRLGGREARGPGMVYRNLSQGLALLKVPYVTNVRHPLRGSAGCVLSGVGSLKWAIRQKDRGVFTRLIAGPNIVVSPRDEGSILFNPAIDAVVVPSMWVAEYYRSQGLRPTAVEVWPSGVAVPEVGAKEKTIDFLIYSKTINLQLVSQVASALQRRGQTHRVLHYGKFTHHGYLQLLESSRYLIYISDTESQGMAMFEAWARDVPSLHYERGFFERENVVLRGNTASPYVTDEVGLRFKNVDEFCEKLEILPGTSFNPRRYVLEHFSLKKCASDYLAIATGNIPIKS